jgi:CHAD domain-containing protein
VSETNTPAAGRDQRPTTSTEVERKFRVHGLYRLPDLVAAGAVAGMEDCGVTTLDATYYDTEDLRLAREGITLRRRVGGDDEGWHLKLPAGLIGDARVREEIQLPLEASGPDEVAAELRHLVGALVRSDELRPVATLRTERHTFRLWVDPAQVPPEEEAAEGAEGVAEEQEPSGEHQPVALLTDDLVSVLDNDGRLVARFRELELEDLPDTQVRLAGHAAVGVSATLAAAGAVTGEFVSKAVRALGPFAVAPPEVPEPDDVTPDQPARDAIRAHLARHTRRLRSADIGVRRDLPDSVHQMRVSARRLRSGLRVFRPLLDRQWADDLRDELAWVAGELGDYRDTEVLLDRLEGHLDRLPEEVDREAARTHIEGVLTQRLEHARERARAMLDSKRYHDVHVRLVSASADPATTEAADRPGRQVIPPLVERAWRTLAKEADRLLEDEKSMRGGAPDEEWHQTRISAKKARYAAEAAAPVFGDDATAFAKQLARVTEVLGEHQDAAIAIDRIVELAHTTDVPPTAAFGLGALLGVERDSAQETRETFAGVWDEVSKRRWRRWLQA